MNLILNLHSIANVRKLMNITDAEAGSKSDFSLGKYVIRMDMVIGMNICE
jgi:hypothetical protein